MFRLIFFLGILILSTFFGWWMFLPLAILYVFWAKNPYELIIAGGIMDTVYYFGESFFWEHFLALFSFVAILISVFLQGEIQWEKRI